MIFIRYINCASLFTNVQMSELLGQQLGVVLLKLAYQSGHDAKYCLLAFVLI